MFASLTAAALISMTLVTAPAHQGQKDIVETAVAAGSFNTLATALTEAGLVEALQGDGPFTVFAPTDKAFAALPEGTVATLLKPENRDQLVSILTYHVVPGRVGSEQVVKLDNAGTLNGQRVAVEVTKRGVLINGALVTTVDIECSNGVIHVIDSVLLPSQDDIVGTAVKAGSFNTLVAAVKAAGLAETLTGKGPFTVLAPTDEAFAKLPAGTVESLLLPENLEKLQGILTYHVIPGRVYSQDALSGLEFNTVQSSPILFSVKDDQVMVEGAKVVAVDLDTTNGVIHVIDTVLMPPAKSRPMGMAAPSCSDSNSGT